MSRTRPAWRRPTWRLALARRGHLPDLPPVEPNQVAYVINNVEAEAIFVENPQQAAKVESVRSGCPSLRHVITMEAHGKFPAGAITVEDVMASRGPGPDPAQALARGLAGSAREHLATVVHTSGTTANPGARC